MDLQENRKLLKINARILNENDKLRAQKANLLQTIKDTLVSLTKIALQIETLVDKLQKEIDKQEGRKLRE